VNNINIFCFGFGQVAKNFINKIKSENFKINLSITSTSKTCQKSINGFDYENFFLKMNLMTTNLLKNLKKQIIF
jgi:hypothetical protein